MPSPQYSLSWNSFKSNICNGFAELQQKQEFVDMTLVAEGHSVKVHKSLICLASPFIKQIIVAVPCEHPIIFLNNISNETLCYLLEYLYTGEVKVEVDKLQAFLKAANDLKLCGLENETQQNGDESSVLQKDTVDQSCMEDLVKFDYGTSRHTAEDLCDDTATQHQVCNSAHMMDDGGEDGSANNMETNTDVMDVGNELDSETQAVEATHVVDSITIDSTGALPQQYSVSNRGSLQLIFNRFIYHMHHQALCGRKRRWRCIDYRRSHCRAYVDTLDEAITARKNAHTHPHHDEKIIKKIRAKQMYGCLSTAIQGAEVKNKTGL